MKGREPSANPRKKPLQVRSEQTVATILEAASQVLAERGESGVTTTAVAERAGFSIGTLYQYFPNRDAVLVALSERDYSDIVKLIQETPFLGSPEGDEVLRRFIRSLVTLYSRRIGARRQFTLIMQDPSTRESLFPRQDIVDVLIQLWASHGAVRSADEQRTRAFVLTRAVGGVLRAAALDGASLLRTRAFEDLLFGLIKALLRADALQDPPPPRTPSD